MKLDELIARLQEIQRQEGGAMNVAVTGRGPSSFILQVLYDKQFRHVELIVDDDFVDYDNP